MSRRIQSVLPVSGESRVPRPSFRVNGRVALPTHHLVNDILGPRGVSQNHRVDLHVSIARSGSPSQLTPGISTPSVNILQLTRTSNRPALKSSTMPRHSGFGVSLQTYRALIPALVKLSVICFAAMTVGQNTKVDRLSPARAI